MQTAVPSQALGHGRRTLAGYPRSKAKNTVGISGKGLLAQVPRDADYISVSIGPSGTHSPWKLGTWTLRLGRPVIMDPSFFPLVSWFVEMNSNPYSE